MKVFLLKDVANVGMAGEVLKVKEGYGLNFLIPRKLAVKLTAKNEAFYASRIKLVANRKEVISSNTSMLGEKIKTLKLSLKRKMHDDGKLYGAISSMEIVDLLAKEGVTVSKSQVKFNKNIKEKGEFTVDIKLTSKLQSAFSLKIVPEKKSA
ncbi:MAG: large subunit ribosomal protein L9 [Alteromonas naphthalenivorans]|jgi:large subunit ribosomal protein L9